MRALHRFLTHPATILCAVGLGFVAGFRFPAFSLSLRPLARILGEIPARYFLRERPSASIDIRLCELPPPDHIVVAVRPDAPGLVRWVDGFLLERGISYDASAVIEHQGPWSFEAVGLGSR